MRRQLPHWLLGRVVPAARSSLGGACSGSLDIHAGTMMAYPVGDEHGASSLTLLCVLAGCLALYRRDRKTTLAVLVAPFGLGLIAAFLGRYPYGGDPRIMLYAGAVDLPAGGAGTGGSCSAAFRRLRLQRRAFLGILRRPGTPRRRPDGPRPGETLSRGRRRPDARLRALVLDRANRPRRAGLPEVRHGPLVSSPVSGGSACRPCTCFTSGCSRSGTASGDRWILILRSIPRTGRCGWSLSITCPRESRPSTGGWRRWKARFELEANRDLRHPAGQAGRGLAARRLRRARAGSSRASWDHGPAACSRSRPDGGSEPFKSLWPKRMGQDKLEVEVSGESIRLGGFTVSRSTVRQQT